MAIGHWLVVFQVCTYDVNVLDRKFEKRHQPRTRSRRREDVRSKRSLWIDLIEDDVEEEGQ